MRSEIFICFMAMGFFMATADSMDHESIVPFPSFTRGPHEIPDEGGDSGTSPWVWVGVAGACLVVSLGVGWGVWRYYHRPTVSTSPRGSDGGPDGGPQQTTLDMPPLTSMPPLTAMRPLLTMPRELRVPWRDQRRQRVVETSTTSGSTWSSDGSNDV